MDLFDKCQLKHKGQDDQEVSPEWIGEGVHLGRVAEMFGHQSFGSGKEVVDEDHGVVAERLGREDLPQTHLRTKMVLQLAQLLVGVSRLEMHV